MRSTLSVGALAMLETALPNVLASSLSAPPVPSEKKRYFAPVKVERNRLIRTVVGLRPFRRGGFVVEAGRLGEKFLVHNYGHGGAGVTLSWGTSSAAVDLIREFNLPAAARSFAVLGCGVIGLTTARLIQRRLPGVSSVAIYAKNLPPETTSNVAGAFWSPTSVYDQDHITTKFSHQFQTACVVSNRAFQTLVGADYGVHWIDTYELLSGPADLEGEPAGGAHLYPDLKVHKDAKKYFGVDHVREYKTMLIEPHIYLNALLRDFQLAGGKVVVKEFSNLAEVSSLSEQVVFNCTGLGARALFDDRNLIPVRGQLALLLPQPEIDYIYLGGSAYMFPRRDGIILGGTWDRGDWELEPDPDQTAALLESHAEIMKRMKK
ncbi:MAG: FAD-dependent oxidoreductase [Pyrinomonadaceae bacterium]